MSVEDSRIVLKDLAIALGVLALLLGGLFLWIALAQKPSPLFEVFSDPSVPRKVPEVKVEVVEKTRPEIKDTQEDIPRYIVSRHTVVGGQSFSLITGLYWDDVFLWPDLWVHNDMASGDPDLIYPDEIVDIYNRLGEGNTYNDKEKKMILDAYMQVYKRFKDLGPDKDASAWTLLWCGAKYDHGFLDIYADRIDPKDLEMAKRYIDEEGFLD